MKRHFALHRLNQSQRIRLYLILSPALFVVGLLFFNSMIVSLLLQVLLIPAELHYIKQIEYRLKREMSDQFRDLLYSLSASIATGRQMREALEDATEALKIIYDEKSLLCIELTKILKQVGETNESLEKLLLEFADRTKVQDIQSFVDIYMVSRKTGGNLEKVIHKTADILLERMELEKSIRVLTAQKRMESRIMVIMPFLVLLFLRVSSPEYLQVMYSTWFGRMLMSIALISIISSYLLSMKFTQIEL
jgi:tight adherence protein B